MRRINFGTSIILTKSELLKISKNNINNKEKKISPESVRIRGIRDVI